MLYGNYGNGSFGGRVCRSARESLDVIYQINQPKNRKGATRVNKNRTPNKSIAQIPARAMKVSNILGSDLGFVGFEIK